MRILIVTVFVCLLGACDDSTDLSPAPHDAGADTAAKDASVDAPGSD